MIPRFNLEHGLILVIDHVEDGLSKPDMTFDGLLNKDRPVFQRESACGSVALHVKSFVIGIFVSHN
jgi:hypothetical protein